MSDRIRVVQFLSSLVRSGAEEVALELVRGLDPARFKSYLVCPPELLQAFNDKWRVADAEAIPLRLSSPLQWTSGRAFMRILRERNIDIVNAHMIRAATAAVPLARLAGVKHVLHTCHGREAWRRRWLSRRYWLDRRISQWSDTTIAVSESTRTWLLEEKKLRPEQVIVVRNGRTLDATRDRAREDALRGQFNLPPGIPLIGVFGRLEEQKGHTYLIDAIPQLLRHFPGLKVLFVGDGVLREALRKQLDDLGVAASVVFTGYRHDWASFMALVDIVVLPSLYEGMPLVPIEAAALGKPVVATSVDGTVEVVIHGETGLLVPPREPRLLGEAIVRLLRDPAEARRMSSAAMSRAQQMFSLEQQIKATERVYESLMGRPTAARAAAGGR